MSVLETTVAPVVQRRRLKATRGLHSLPLWMGPVAFPVAVALVYLAVLIVRFPQIVSWQDADSDVASMYALAAALAHGHHGQVQLSTQGSWLELGWMTLTAGLGAHRVLWELGTPALGLISVLVVVRLVARVGGRGPAVLCAAVLAAASPMVLMCAISVNWHNTIPLCAALFGSHLVWLGRRQRTTLAVLGSVIVVGLFGGFLVACDELNGVVAVAPYLIAAVLVSRGSGSRRELIAAVETFFFVLVGMGSTNLITRALDIGVTVPQFGLRLNGIGSRAVWLEQGVLRLGDGRWVAAHSALLTPLIVACAVVTVAAVAAMIRLAVRLYGGRATDRRGRVGALHTCYWTVSAFCAAAAYLFSTRVVASADQYIVVIMYAVAATVPLLVAADGSAVNADPPVTSARRRRWVAAAATIFAAGSLVALATGEMHHRAVVNSAPAEPELAQIERVVRADHLGVGFAGYWDASSLQWSSHGRLQIAPLIEIGGAAEAMYYLRASDWYRPRLHTGSYIVLVPGDQDFPDHLPAGLPAPSRVIHLGTVTIDAWPYDVAAWLHRSLIPVPGMTSARLSSARRVERSETWPASPPHR